MQEVYQKSSFSASKGTVVPNGAFVFFEVLAVVCYKEGRKNGEIIAGAYMSCYFNIMHDSNHGSYSKNKTINRILGYTMDLIGSSHTLWKQKHNILHHTYTNIAEADNDIEVGPLLRLHPSQGRSFIHRFQHIYFIFRFFRK